MVRIWAEITHENILSEEGLHETEGGTLLNKEAL